ncbi:MAG: 50S ribosomal protein L24 [Acetobacteraceae bacterium]|nr:50S ribosomal protein L24 [Acetobacteraceae bacterium]
MAEKVQVKKGDQVLILAGKDRGKRGKVLRVFPGEGKVLVEGLNKVKKHQRPTSKVMQGGIIDQEAPIDRSKVMLICNKCGRPTRTSRRVLEGGRSVRVCRRCSEIVDR